MMRCKVLFALASVVGLAIAPGIAAYAKKKNADEARQFLQQIQKDQRIEQALNRLTFGARPGDEAAVKAMGLKVWIDRQLHPNQIAENPVLLEKLKTLDTLNLAADKLVREYPSPQMVKQMVAGQMPFPSDPDKKMMIRKLVAKYEKQGDQPNPNAPPDPAELRKMLTDRSDSQPAPGHAVEAAHRVLQQLAER